MLRVLLTVDLGPQLLHLDLVLHALLVAAESLRPVVARLGLIQGTEPRVDFVHHFLLVGIVFLNLIRDPLVVKMGTDHLLLLIEQIRLDVSGKSLFVSQVSSLVQDSIDVLVVWLEDILSLLLGQFASHGLL